MKKNSFILLLVLILADCSSCHHNRLKTNEKALANEIRQQKKKETEEEKATLDMGSRRDRKGFSESVRKKEIRSADRQNPPIRIDIPGNLNNTRDLRLSDIASSVRYVRLEVPPDSILLTDPFFNRNGLISSVQSDDERIIFQGLYGVTIFDMNGKYMETIWKNGPGISLYNGNPFWRFNEFIGIDPVFTPVSLFHGEIVYTFTNGPEKTTMMMKYNPGGEESIATASPEELPGQGKIPGDTLFTANNDSSGRFESVFITSPDSWTGINNKWNSGKSGTLLVTYDNQGDTICNFTDNDRILNFTKSTYRQPVSLVSYQYDGLLTIKPEYNDTVFRMIAPDRLLPAFILDFGEKKVSSREGLDPDLDLSQKLILKSLHETDDYLMIRYTQNQASPNNVRKNSTKFYNALYDKKLGKLIHQPGFTLTPEGIVNDLDGGMPFWPEFITPQGEMMKLVSGKNIKDFINSEAFKKGSATSDQRRKQVSLANGLNDRDMIVIIVK